MENNSDILSGWINENIKIDNLIGLTLAPYGQSIIVLAKVAGQRPKFIGQFFIDNVELKNCPVYTLAGKHNDYFIYVTEDSLYPAVALDSSRMLSANTRLAIKRAFGGHIGVDSLLRENEYLRGVIVEADKGVSGFVADKILGA